MGIKPIIIILTFILIGCSTRSLYHSYKSDEEYQQDASYCSEQYMVGNNQFGNTNLGVRPLFGVGIGTMPENSWDRCMRKLGWREKR